VRGGKRWDSNWQWVKVGDSEGRWVVNGRQDTIGKGTLSGLAHKKHGHKRNETWTWWFVMINARKRGSPLKSGTSPSTALMFCIPFVCPAWCDVPTCQCRGGTVSLFPFLSLSLSLSLYFSPFFWLYPSASRSHKIEIVPLSFLFSLQDSVLRVCF